MGKEDDVISQEEIIRRLWCSVGTFFISNCCWTLLALVMVLIGTLGVVLAGSKMVIFPFEVYITTLVFGGYTLIIIGMGILGTCSRVEICFILYIFFAALGLLGQISSFAFLMLYSTDVAGIKGLTSSTISGDVFLENHLLDLVEDAQTWREAQNSLGCCGVDFEVTFDNEELLQSVETGYLCIQNTDTLVNFRNSITTIITASGADEDRDVFGNIIVARDDDNFGLATEFYCVSKVSGIFQDNIPTVAVVIIIYLLVQLSSLISAGRMYWVPEFLGGWALDEEAENEIAEHKGIKFTAPVQGFKGGRVLSTLRNAGARMSYRFQNAVTADPRVDPGAGFLKRLSTNRAVSFVGAAPGTTPVTEEEPAPRFSVRSMLSVMSKGFGGQKSLIDTSGMGISQKSSPPPGLPGVHSVPAVAQQAATNRNVEVSTKSKLLTSFVENDEHEDSLNI